MWINPDKCNSCGNCVGACTVDAISEGFTGYRIGSECTKCGACKSSCPVSAIVETPPGSSVSYSYRPGIMGYNPIAHINEAIADYGYPISVGFGISPDASPFTRLSSQNDWHALANALPPDHSVGVHIILTF